MEMEIIEYQPRYRDEFKNLNLQWISQFFEVERLDLHQLSQPEEYILATGGKIYFARLNDQIVGTVALKKVNETVFELSKMAVSASHQGLGIGRKLGEKLISDARVLGCRLLFLESNTKLAPAIHLYKKLGFTEVPVENSPYARSNFRAEMYF